jgi:hypothetical protein
VAPGISAFRDGLVQLGWVEGQSVELGPKRLGLLHELLPQALQFGLLVNASVPNLEGPISRIKTSAASIGCSVDDAIKRPATWDGSVLKSLRDFVDSNQTRFGFYFQPTASALSKVGWRLFREELYFRDRPVPRIALVDVYDRPMARRHKLQPKETPPTRRSSNQTSPLQLAKTSTSCSNILPTSASRRKLAPVFRLAAIRNTTGIGANAFGRNRCPR